MPYFDHNATSPLLPVARDAWLRANDEAWANPSSPYRISARTHRLLEEARAQVAAHLGVAPEEIVFTAGATEANNAVIAWAARMLATDASVVVSPTEHPSVLEAMRAQFGARMTRLEIATSGLVSPQTVAHHLARKGGGFVAVMAANNETGLIQTGTMEIDASCRDHDAWYLCDATQWIGRMPGHGLPSHAFLVGSAHKFGGPKGVGILRVPPQAEGFHAQRGGEQERGRRAGTENYPAIAAMAAALEFAAKELLGERLKWVDAFVDIVSRGVSGLVANPGGLWNTVSLRMPAHENTRWVTRLDKLGFEVSTGSACASGSAAPSHVLAAMGQTPDEARRTIRVSCGWETTWHEWQLLADAIVNVWQQLQAENVLP
jgi:cysteine desulfurase